MKPENEKPPGKDLPTTPPSVELLLEKIRLGQKPAVETLLDRHREPLRRMIGLRLDPAIAAREDASDIVQDVLLEAHKRIENYLKNPVMPFHLWLRHIAKEIKGAQCVFAITGQLLNLNNGLVPFPCRREEVNSMKPFLPQPRKSFTERY